MKNNLIKPGNYRVKRRHKRRQGETIEKKKNFVGRAGRLFKTGIGVALFIMVLGGAIVLGLNMANYTTKLHRIKPRASEPAREYKSMAVVETRSGRLLSGYHEADRLPMASTTKIATAIVTIEEMGDLSQEFEVPAPAVGVEGSSMYLRLGEVLKLEEYLYGLMLPSGNDSAVALAHIVAGSEENFSIKLNALAERLGLKNTNFVTASGLHDENHYTSAEDLARLTAYAMKNEAFRKIVGEPFVTIRGSKPNEPRHLKNKQKLMHDDTLKLEGITVTGVKSGFTPEAGRCLVTSAVKDGMEVVVVVLNAPDMFNSTAGILKETFSDYAMTELLPAKKHITTIGVTGSETKQINLYSSAGFCYPMTATERARVKIKYTYPEAIEAPVMKDQELGLVEVTLNGVTLFSAPILSIEEAPANSNDIVKKIIEQM